MTDGTHTAGDGAGEQFKTRGAHAVRRNELCLLPLGDRIAHFAKRSAYDMPDGRVLRMQPPKPLPNLNASSLTRSTDGVFHITKPVIGLPCLGIPTAKYLHGRRDYLIGDTGKMHLTRCHRCELKELCERMCDELLHHSGDAVLAAFREFMNVGGWSAVVRGWTRNDRTSPAAARLRELVKALQAAGVTFANDADVREYEEHRQEREKASAAERQRKSRAARAAGEQPPSGEQPPGDAELMARARALRERIQNAQEALGCPRWLAGVDAKFAAKIWVLREKLASRNKKHGATHIARALAKATPEATHDALRKRVSRVLRVMQAIEALP